MSSTYKLVLYMYYNTLQFSNNFLLIHHPLFGILYCTNINTQQVTSVFLNKVWNYTQVIPARPLPSPYASHSLREWSRWAYYHIWIRGGFLHTRHWHMDVQYSQTCNTLHHFYSIFRLKFAEGYVYKMFNMFQFILLFSLCFWGVCASVWQTLLFYLI